MNAEEREYAERLLAGFADGVKTGLENWRKPMAKHFKEYSGFNGISTRENTKILSYDPDTHSMELITISEGQRATINSPSWSLDIPRLFFDGVSIIQIADKSNIIIESTE